ncbi:hypothetical protein ABZP36_001534 [Zizania latifolia]
MATLGDANTRLEEVSYVVPAMVHLNKELRRHKALSAMAWLVQPLPPVEPAFIANAIEREFGLNQEDFTVHRHYPEDFRLNFHHQRHRDLVSEARKLKLDGLDIHVRPWKLLRHAFGAALRFRVKICIEGIPIHAWRPEVDAAIVGTHYTMDTIDTPYDDSSFDSRTIDVWAWTVNPSLIPKVNWLTLTDFSYAVACPGLSSSQVSSVTPQDVRSKAVLMFRVLLHLDRVDDFSAAPVDGAYDLGGTVVPFKPATRWLPWLLGMIDGTSTPVDTSQPLPSDEPPSREQRRPRVAPHSCRNGTLHSDIRHDDPSDEESRDGSSGSRRWHSHRDRRGRECGKALVDGRSWERSPWPRECHDRSRHHLLLSPTDNTSSNNANVFVDITFRVIFDSKASLLQQQLSSMLSGHLERVSVEVATIRQA